MTELVNGQIYRWRWRDKARDADNAPYRSYHCKSQIAIVRGGLLLDTYWSDLTSSDRTVLDPQQVELTFYADESWPTISRWQIPYYNPADVASMAHANNSRALIYLRPGAQRSKEAILEEIRSREKVAASEIRSAQWSLERLAEARKLADADRLDEVML